MAWKNVAIGNSVFKLNPRSELIHFTSFYIHNVTYSIDTEFTVLNGKGISYTMIGGQFFLILVKSTFKNSIYTLKK